MRAGPFWSVCVLSILATGGSAAADGAAPGESPADAAAWEEALPGLYVNRLLVPSSSASVLSKLSPSTGPTLGGGLESLESLRVGITLPVGRGGAVEQALKETGFEGVERALIIGVRDGAGGLETVAGVVVDPSSAAGWREPGFFPLMKSRDAELVLSLSQRLAEALTSRPVFDPPALPSAALKLVGPCEDACDRRYQSDLSLCSTEEFSCKLAVTGVAMGCVVGCTKFVPGGPLWWGCVAACGVVDIAGLLRCIIEGDRCEATARDDRFDCYGRCEEESSNDDPPPRRGGGGGDPDDGGDPGGGGSDESCADCYCEGAWSGEVCGSTATELVEGCVDRCGGFN